MNSPSSSHDGGWLAAYERGMRYAQRGGYTPAEQQRRERLRLQAAGRFARGDTASQVARDPRVTEGVSPPVAEGLVRIVKRKLKKIRCRPYLIDGCLAGTGLTIEAW